MRIAGVVLEEGSEVPDGDNIVELVRDAINNIRHVDGDQITNLLAVFVIYIALSKIRSVFFA